MPECAMKGSHKAYFPEATVQTINPSTLEKCFICETCQKIEMIVLTRCTYGGKIDFDEIEESLRKQGFIK